MYAADADIHDLLGQMDFYCPHPDHPFDPNAQVQPCSIDLRVSDIFWKPSRRRRLYRRLEPRGNHVVDLRRSALHDLDPRRDWKRVGLGTGEAFTLKPNHVLMGRIYERFKIPPGYAGKIEGRSSFARLGLQVHCTGDFINPGWDGYMPLQLYNAGPYPLRITPFLDICQLMLVQLSRVPDRTYGHEELQSKYVNDDGGPSLWWRDARVRNVQRFLGERHATERMRKEIVELVRFESADILERFEQFVSGRRVDQVENAEQLLEDFAKKEDGRRLFDKVAVWAPGALFGVGAGSLFVVDFVVWHVVVGVLFVASLVVALRSYVRSEDGYLGEREVRNARDRPQLAS